MPQSAWSRKPDKYDLTFLDPVSGGTNDIGVMLVRDKQGVAEWSGEQQSALTSEQFTAKPQAYLWKNGGQGAGFSKRAPEITASTKGGALTATGYSYGEWVTSVVPEILMPSGSITTMTTPASVTTGTIVDGISYGGAYYLTTSGRYLIKIASETGTPTAVDMGASYTCVNLAVFQNYLWISGQASGTIRRYDGSSLTNGGAGTERSRLAVVNWTISPQIATGGAANTGGTNAQRMIGTDPTGVTFQHVADTANPTVDADWSGDIKIGDGASYPTQWVCANNHTVWFATSGGVYAVDETGYSPNLTEWMKLHYNANNGGQAVYWNGVIWFAHASGLVVVPVSGERQDLAERWAQFGYLQPNQTPIYGRPVVLAPGGDCLWVGYYNDVTATSYVMRLLIDGENKVRWSGAEAVFSSEVVSLIRRVSPASGTPYLLIATQVASGASAPKIYRQELPVSGNPYVDYVNGTGYTSYTASKLYVPREDMESASRKVVEDYTVVCRNLGDGNSVAIYASVDDGAYALQATALISGRHRLPAPTTQTGGVNWNWRLNLTGQASVPWVLESFGAGMTTIPDDQNTRTYKVIVYAEQELHGGMSGHDPDRLWNGIEALRRRDFVRMRDQWGRVRRGRVLQTVPHSAYWDEQRETWALVGSITVRFLHRVASYNAGYAYNAGAYYGASA